ncbi:Harbinger transposase-derived nuclease domain [Phytophthora cactorum]|nr:Harbinger transposase-derived nuclease domain [Phytophthora cactorum]
MTTSSAGQLQTRERKLRSESAQVRRRHGRTLIPLAFQPVLNGEDYYTRKGSYALNALICCDDRAKVMYALTGWPGSTHDNRVWSNSRPLSGVVLFPGRVPLDRFGLSSVALRVPPFTKLPGAAIALNQDFFNTKLARFVSHGALHRPVPAFQGRPRFDSQPRRPSEDYQLFSSSLVIHNLLIHDPIPAELDEDISAEVKKKDRSAMETRQARIARGRQPRPASISSFIFLLK